jgi:cation diffusion facilitator family transporter
VSAVPAPPEPDRDESATSVLAALAANTTIAIAKGTAAALTGSPALLAETLHTIADTGNEVLLYLAVRSSRREPDATHPLGYGPDRYFWALIAAIGMFVIGGAVSLWEGIQAVLDPPELEAFWVGVGVLVIALLLDGTSRAVALRQLRREARQKGITVRELLKESSDPTVVTVYFEDSIDVLGAALALLALVLHRVSGSGVPDAIVTCIIGLLLAFTALRLTQRNRRLLSNQALPERYVEQLRARIEAEPAIARVERLDAVYLGTRDVLLVADVRMADGLDGADLTSALTSVRDRIHADVPAVSRIALTPVSAAD